jgi:hypothetical protein
MYRYNTAQISITQLSHLVNVPRDSATGRVQLRLRLLSRMETKEWEQRINFALGACGCQEARRLLLPGLLVMVVLAPFNWAKIRARATAVALSTATILACLAFAGKRVGKLKAKRELKAMVESLTALLQARGAKRGMPVVAVLPSFTQSQARRRNALLQSSLLGFMA